MSTNVVTSASPRPARRLGKILSQLVRFGLVGGLNTVIDVVLFNILVWIFPTSNMLMLIALNSLAYFMGSCNSFFLNKLWTFRQRSNASSGQVIRFMVVTGLGILCNDLFLWLATVALNAFSLQNFLWTNVAKVVAIGGSVAVSYLGMRFSVFTRDEEPMEALSSTKAHLFMQPSSLSVILPAYNEEASIEKTLQDSMQTLLSWMENFEIIVINDGSKDRTGEIVARLSAADRRIRLINHNGNKGYGAALVTGFEAVTKELAFFMDSDGQFDLRDLARFFPLIQEYGAVLGYRIARQDTWMRKLNAWGWKQLVHFMFNVKARDIDCAFKLFRSDFFRTHRLETRGAMINAEILYKLARAGYTTTEVGVQHYPRTAGKATGAKPTVILRALREMFYFAGKWHQEEQQLTSRAHQQLSQTQAQGSVPQARL